MPILHSYYQDVYRCPIVRLDGYSAQHGLSTGILAYLDFGGATGSSKDGLAETMLAFATERGTLQPGMPVVEASSGSFGAALAVSCATTGHPCILVVPSNLPIAQRKRLQDLGAHIIACSSSGAAPWSVWPRTPPSATADITPTFFQRRQPRVPPPRDGAADL